jgi:cytosine/uracil/thiamine/allantoin permease
MDYAPGARYCSFCGGPREPLNAEPQPKSQPDILRDGAKFWRRAGLSVPAIVCLVSALVFAVAALLTGVIYKEETLVDWQAVQTWRIQWLLGAVVALLAGILLKKSNSKD